MSMLYLRQRLNSGLTFSQHINARNFADTSDLLDKHRVKSLYFYSLLYFEGTALTIKRAIILYNPVSYFISLFHFIFPFADV